MTTQSGQLHEKHSRTVTRDLDNHHLALSSRMDQHYQDLSSRLTILGRLILQQAHGEAAPPYTEEAAATMDETGASRSRKIDGLQVFVSQPNKCSTWCPCACHAKRKPKVTELGIVEKVIGKMFIGYAGLPFLNKKCDFRGCRHQRAPTVIMEYWFPWWFVAMNVKLDFKYLPTVGSQFQVTTSRRVPDNSQSIAFVMQRDIDGLRYLFNNGLASPRDVSDSRGFTLMRWALYGEWRYDVVQFLISQGAPVDEISYDNV
ncbi:hypothetical protein M501DRAFT_163004 [Patellaria atrata CBS 101060]|uniref:Ankyrin n=1 Tax=Patellaria atrata CBS 101060 TaxID=1346257 RepID=A0A9P4VRY4_9PEZI|nr:hypothetical protein M501DRAFT_163004 [Patellaria atrata CBS 101060]